jgi:quercetin dioxygenase-like cupin family protein
METITVKDAWATRGFSCGIWSDPPGQVWEDYIHDADELLMLIDGEIEARMNGRLLRPAAGEELFIPVGTVHTVINNGAHTNRWFYGYRL